MKTYTVATNKSPIGPYRGVGRPGACFAIERTIDEVARAVGRDPLEVRMENMVTSAQMPYTTIANLKFDNGDYPAAVKLCAEAIDLAAVRARQKRGEPDGRLIGVGFACYSEQTGHGCGEWVSRGSPFIPGYESCTRATDAGRHAGALVGIQSHGQGLETTLAQIAHEELGIDPARISVRHGDTGLSPFGIGTIASRSIVMAGGASRIPAGCCGKRSCKIGAHLLQCDPADVRCEGGKVVGRSGAVGIDEVARVAHLRMEALPQGVEPLLDRHRDLSARHRHRGLFIRHPCRGRGGRSGDRHDRAPRFRGGGRLRHHDQSDDRRRPGARRRRAGHRHRALRGNPL